MYMCHNLISHKRICGQWVFPMFQWPSLLLLLFFLFECLFVFVSLNLTIPRITLCGLSQRISIEVWLKKAHTYSRRVLKIVFSKQW